MNEKSPSDVNPLKRRNNSEEFDKEYYIRFLGKKPKLDTNTHWEKANKTTFTLFNVLMDQDLTELVKVLEHFPDYIQLVCEHFRYSYSYNENQADMVAASKLITLGDTHITKQFLRNVLAKLEKITDYDMDEMKEFLERLEAHHPEMHPIVIKHFCRDIHLWMEYHNLHKLQQTLFNKRIKAIEPDIELDVIPADRDKEVLIPYAH